MTDQPQQTNPNEHRYYPEDEIELMDYLLVIWKWKHIILAGTLAFALVAAIISFIAWKQQPTMYRTHIVLQPGLLKIDEKGEKVFIDTPENIKALLENDLKYKVSGNIKTSNNTNLSNSLDFQVDIPKGSNNINVSLVSTLVDEGTTKLNYLIKALFAELANKIKFKQEGYEKEIDSKKEKMEVLQAEIENIKRSYLNQIEQKKTLLAELKEKETIGIRKYELVIESKKTLLKDLKLKEAVARKRFEIKIQDQEALLRELRENEEIAKKLFNIGNKIQIKKIELAELLLREKKTKSQVESYKQTLSKLESNNKFFKNTNSNDIEKYVELKENAKISLMKIQASIDNKLEEIKDLENAERNNEADPVYQPELYKIQEDITSVSKELKKLENVKENNEADPISQSELYKIQEDITSVSKEIEKFEKAKNIKNTDSLLQPELYKIQKDIIEVTKELKKLEKGKNNIQDDINYKKRFSDLQKNIAEISKTIENLEKEKLNIQTVRIIQPPVTTEIPKNIKIKRNIILSVVIGIFLMLFLTFYLEYISKYKSRLQK